jgi:predicted glutamine amidotransferase
MCRMVGVVFRDQFPTSVLTDLRIVSRDGNIPDHRRLGHRDGWGIASFVKESPSYLGRSPKWAAEDPMFEDAVSRASELRPPNIVIGHVRAASRGGARLVNAHPFVVGGIVFGHNGTVKGLDSITTQRRRLGQTDSELLALALADKYEQKRDLRTALKRVIREEVLGREFTGAIMLASDGETLCGYRDYSENGDYYDLRLAVEKKNVILFQETSSGIDGSVSQVKRRELVTIGLDLEVRRESIG